MSASTEESPLARVVFFGPMAVIVFLGIGGGLLVSSDRAVQAAVSQGYRDVSVTDWHALGPVFHGCERSDSAAFTVTATDGSGEHTEATVCCPLFSACTVRR